MARLFSKALVAATVLHGALFGALSNRALRPTAEPALIAALDTIELSIEVEPSAPVRAADAQPDATADAPPPDAPQPAAAAVDPGRLTDRLHASQLPPPTAPTGTEVAPAPVASAAISPFAPSPFGDASGSDGSGDRGRQAVAGLMRGNGSWLLNPGSGAGAGQVEATGRGPRRDDDPDKGGRLLRESLDRANSARGLGFGGPVVGAAQTAVHAAGAPSQGKASFEVITDATGAIVSITPRGASGGDWSPVLAALRAQLAGRKLRVPEGANGVAVTVQVEAKQQLPSGKAEGSGPVHMTGVGTGEFDLADLGGKVARVVSARIVNERRL